MATTIIPQDGKFIQYDRQTKDYACYLDGQLIGYQSTYSQAETFINDTYYEHLSHASTPVVEPTAPITVETWQGEGGETYTDFSIGTGLTKVMFGTYENQEAGIELVIGGCCINERVVEVITMADARTLRDNLTALLQDPCVQASWAEPSVLALIEGAHG